MDGNEGASVQDIADSLELSLDDNGWMPDDPNYESGAEEDPKKPKRETTEEDPEAPETEGEPEDEEEVESEEDPEDDKVSLTSLIV